MDEFVISDIDADMVDEALLFFGGVKKNKITLFELISFKFTAKFPLSDGCSRQVDAVFFGDIAGKSGTVKSLGTVGTPDISFTQMLFCLLKHRTPILYPCKQYTEWDSLVRNF